MANLFDELQRGTVSRRQLFQLLAAAGGSSVLAAAQTKQSQSPQPAGGAAPKISPANIGGGGRIESRAFSSSDPNGTWTAFATYQDAQGWHDGPSVTFTVAGTTPPPPAPRAPPGARAPGFARAMCSRSCGRSRRARLAGSRPGSWGSSGTLGAAHREQCPPQPYRRGSASGQTRTRHRDAAARPAAQGVRDYRQPGDVEARQGRRSCAFRAREPGRGRAPRRVAGPIASGRRCWRRRRRRAPGR